MSGATSDDRGMCRRSLVDDLMLATRLSGGVLTSAARDFRAELLCRDERASIKPLTRV
jgi:hypothetical protein